MLRMSKKIEYALIGILHMSQKGSGVLTTARELSSVYQIPQELMGKVLQKLVKAGMIASEQGVKGGYRIRKPPEEITLSYICRAMDEPIRIVSCVPDRGGNDCEQHPSCNIKNPMEIVQKKLETYFSSITLKDLKNEIVLSAPGDKADVKDAIGKEPVGVV